MSYDKKIMDEFMSDYTEQEKKDEDLRDALSKTYSFSAFAVRYHVEKIKENLLKSLKLTK